MSKPVSRFDIVLAGGGATGLSFLLALQYGLSQSRQRLSQPLRVALVETWTSDSEQQHPGFDGRALALSQQTLQLFSQLGQTAAIEQLTSPIRHIHVSDQGGAGQCTLNCSDYQLNKLGAVVEAHQLGAILTNAVAQNIKADVINLTQFQPEQITDVEQTQDEVIARLQNGEQIAAKLLVLAEGGRSSTREHLPIKVTTTDYQQSAVIANILTEKSHQDTAYERFTAQGPLAFLPMSDNRTGVVWSVSSDDVQRFMEKSDQQFLEALQQAFGYRLGKIVKVGKRAMFPLALVKADDRLAHRTVCIGNAAQTLHPIAGQGFNLAIRDAWCLALNIAESASDGVDIGSYIRLNRFRQLRHKDKENTIVLTDGLVRLFSNKNPILRAGRNFGLMTMQLNDFSKSAFANLSMGKNARLPQHQTSSYRGVAKHD